MRREIPGSGCGSGWGRVYEQSPAVSPPGQTLRPHTGPCCPLLPAHGLLFRWSQAARRGCPPRSSLFLTVSRSPALRCPSPKQPVRYSGPFPCKAAAVFLLAPAWFSCAPDAGVCRLQCPAVPGTGWRGALIIVQSIHLFLVHALDFAVCFLYVMYFWFLCSSVTSFFRVKEIFSNVPAQP